ncbi:4Fe-4S dicluster domain-containing protein [Thermaerobacter sp. FW80]|nr:MAG: 4Fe-4S ferredoxin [Bacillota bacterium]QBS37925.1 4Fe-4S dicluster domain-containing protein [Thermaerobacter sp. FW80]
MSARAAAAVAAAPKAVDAQAGEGAQASGGAKPMSIQDKLYLDRFNADKQSHLFIIDPDVCLTKCPEQYCTKFCPAHVYEWDPEAQKILVGYEGCVECGTCRIGCPFRNIKWLNPRGGYGVQYRQG